MASQEIAEGTTCRSSSYATGAPHRSFDFTATSSRGNLTDSRRRADYHDQSHASDNAHYRHRCHRSQNLPHRRTRPSSTNNILHLSLVPLVGKELLKRCPKRRDTHRLHRPIPWDQGFPPSSLAWWSEQECLSDAFKKEAAPASVAVACPAQRLAARSSPDAAPPTTNPSHATTADTRPTAAGPTLPTSAAATRSGRRGPGLHRCRWSAPDNRQPLAPDEIGRAHV